MIEKLDGMSKDLVRENVEKLKELFPSIVKEGKIDFEELELLLGENINRSKEHYSFVWNGKTEATKLAQKRSTGTLRPCVADSVGRNGEKGVWDNETKNLYIEGDNLEVLKLLQASYNGRIKMIYIDPPYNTGHDFVYKDNFEDNLKNYKEITGQAQKSNAESDGRYHTNWLNMMYPRLKLARNLLDKDGVIFISIDDNEVANLKKICDEIFGENNFVACICQKHRDGISNDKIISNNHNFLLMYAKSFEKIHANRKNYGITRTEEDFKNYKKNDNDGKGFYTLNPVTGPGGARKGNPYYEILGVANYWRYSKETMQNLIDEGKVVKINNNLYQKSYKNDYLGKKKGSSTWWDVGTTSQGTIEVKNILGKSYFDFAKPVSLITYILDYIDIEENDIILDFFSGSATTAQAVLEFGFQKNIKLNFIMVQLPELTEPYSEAFKDGFQTICEIGKERIRRAGKKIKNQLTSDNAQLTNKGQEENNCQLSSVNCQLDIGFKVLKLDTSNLKKWNNEPTKDAEEVAKRIQISMDYMEEGREEIDLVYEIMIKYGINLTNPVEKTANGKAYIVTGETYKLLICSAPNITLEDVEAFSNESVGTYLFADRCFTDDNLLINAQEILKAKNKEMRLF